MNTNKQTIVERLTTGLKRERLAYKIYGIVFLVLSIVLIICGIVTMAGGAYLTDANTDATELSFNSSIILDKNSGIEFNDDNIVVYDGNDSITFTEDDAIIFAGVSVIAMGGFFIGFGASLAAVAIVNLVLASRAGKHSRNEESTIKHAGSVGSIVLAALFNEIALIFVIINFVVAKKNRAALAA